MADLDGRGRRMQLAGLAIVALGSLAFVAMGVGEMVGGDPSGVQHLPEAALLGALVYLGWRHPHAVGIALVLLSIGIASLYAVAGPESVGLRFAWGLQIALPPFVAGALLIRAARRGDSHPAAPRTPPPSPHVPG
jgi:hypothetical protein